MSRIEYNRNGDVVLRVVKSINVNFEIINYIYEFMKKNKIPTFSKAVEQIISEHMILTNSDNTEATGSTENVNIETGETIPEKNVSQEKSENTQKT